VPFCKVAVFERLAAFPEAYQPPVPPEPEPLEPVPAITGVPLSRDAITTGSLVLAPEEEIEGWYESVVVEAKAESMFVLRWRDWPGEPTLVRGVENLGLLLEGGTPIG
jgi:hypothetical protein